MYLLCDLSPRKSCCWAEDKDIKIQLHADGSLLFYLCVVKPKEKTAVKEGVAGMGLEITLQPWKGLNPLEGTSLPTNQSETTPRGGFATPAVCKPIFKA